jgi:hypothetical protein
MSSQSEAEPRHEVPNYANNQQRLRRNAEGCPTDNLQGEHQRNPGPIEIGHRLTGR